MKPVYEIVKACEIRGGDTIRAGLSDHEDYKASAVQTKSYVQIVSIANNLGDKGVQWDDYHEGELVLRQLPPERNPDVLMRALHIAIVALYDDKLYVPTAADPQNYIRQAIRELESEAGR